VGCLIVILAMLMPRGVLFLIWLLTGWFGAAYQTWHWPLLGFLFMPYTTLAYMAAMLNNNHSLSGWWLVLVVLAVLTDLGLWGGGSKRRRKKRAPHAP
jgi:cytochrome b561